MHPSPRSPLTVLWAVLLALSCLCALAHAQTTPRKRVLVLHSYHKGLAWTDAEDEGMREVLAARQDIEVFTEYLDAKRFPDAPQLADFSRLLKTKYAASPPDVILLSDEDAFHYLRAGHAELFPGVPVVFCGVNDQDAALSSMSRGLFTGVVEAYDLRSTLRVAQKLQPELKRLVVINDDTPTGLANEKVLAEVLPEFKKSLTIERFSGLTLEQTLARVRTLGPGDAIALLTFNRDAAGRVVGYDEAIALLSAAAKVPIYGVWDFYLGKGIVGGMLTSGLDQGRVAATLALRILGGEALAALPVVRQSPSYLRFDDARLKQFDIDESRLPPGAEVVNRPTSFYEEHRGKVLAVVSVIAVLFALLLALVANIQRRKRIEASLRESEEKFETIFRHSPDWIAILSLKDGRYVDVNDAFEKITGFTRAEVLGRTSLDIGIYANPTERYELNEAFLREGRTHNQELRYRLKSGEVITVQRSAELVEFGGEKCIVSIVRDITGIKAAEQAVLETERQKKLRTDAEVKMLQAQINPHFLFNALSTIMHYVRTRPDTAYELLLKLSDFFRKNIKPGSDRVSLSKEIEHCEDYVAIERARFEERLSVHYAIDPRALSCKLPALILQPLVENALKHGILPVERGGTIVVSAVCEDRQVRICVQDDGVGMSQARIRGLLDPDVPRKREEGAGLALGNVDARLKGFYGPEHGLSIDSEPGFGTTVSFSVPGGCP